MMGVNWPAVATLGVQVGACLICILIPAALWKRFSSSIDLGAPYEMQPKGQSFQFLLEKYFDIAKLLISLSVGSIALLAGYIGYIIQSDASKLSKIQYFVAPPVTFFAFSVLYSIVLIVLLVSRYEGYLHDDKSYTGSKYAMNLAIGFSSLACFVIGYLILAIAVVSIAL